MAKIPARFRPLVVSGGSIRIHKPCLCDGQTCVFHKPSKHKMRKWKMVVRTDRYLALVERICAHGVGHPDPDSLAYIESTLPESRRGYEGVHGCDGCCHEPTKSPAVNIDDYYKSEGD